MSRVAPLWGVAGLIVAALAAAVAPMAVQLVFAVLAIGVVGMAHGASDLAVVAAPRRATFLALYLLVSATCLLWWVAEPALALPLFLVASAIHFGVEDASPDAPVERIARGLALVTVPAALHVEAYATILSFASGREMPGAVVPTLALTGVLAAAALLVIATRRRDARLVLGTAALLALPPLVGFSVGFLLLHALPQTEARRVALGCETRTAYLRAVAPILILALAFATLVGLVLLRLDHTGIRPLFAAIAALAMPHLLVTPWFEGRGQQRRLAFG